MNMKAYITKREGKATYSEMREAAMPYQLNGYTVRIKKDAEHGFFIQITKGSRDL